MIKSHQQIGMDKTNGEKIIIKKALFILPHCGCIRKCENSITFYEIIENIVWKYVLKSIIFVVLGSLVEWILWRNIKIENRKKTSHTENGKSIWKF